MTIKTAPLPASSLRNKVPAVTAAFWVTKALTTAFGESSSDYLVHRFAPVAAVLVGFVAFCAAISWQFAARRYRVWIYWLAVAMVGVFGTMAADVLHVGFRVPYAVSSAFFAVALGCVFTLWYRSEGTLSVHAIDTRTRETYYWLAVVTTFALGTAAGDLLANTLHLGYLAAGIVFAAAILAPGAGYRWFGLNGVAAFWAAYVLTRPVGASFADWFGKPHSLGGLGVGDGVVSFALLALIVACVAAMARRPVSSAGTAPA